MTKNSETVFSSHATVDGDWKCTLKHHIGGAVVRVAAAIDKDDNGNWIAVVTVF